MICRCEPLYSRYGSHRHFPYWLMDVEAVDNCKCGQHPRRMLIGALVRDFLRQRGKAV